jgi:two-component system, LytTR family, response regulator
VRIVGEADTGVMGLQAAEALRPDLLLIALRLRDTTGLDVLRALPSHDRRRSIMVTHDARDAATAIAAGAIGCLVKPLSEDAFSASILQARQSLTPRSAVKGGLARVAASAVPYRQAEPSTPIFLVGERQRRLYPLDPSHIEFVESAGNYVKYHLAQYVYIARESIKRLDVMLASAGFIRIERSLLLNIRAIAFVELIGHGTFAFTLTSGACLHSGYAYRDAILSALPLRRRAPKREKSSKAARDGVVALRPKRKGGGSKVGIS